MVYHETNFKIYFSPRAQGRICDMEQRIKIKELNEFITCSICSGYLINASTVTECLHTCTYIFDTLKMFSTFDHISEYLIDTSKIVLVCRSCIVKHLEENTHCPKCEQVIHHSHPMNYLRCVHQTKLIKPCLNYH